MPSMNTPHVTTLMVAIASLLVWNAQAQNLIVNGDFEDPVQANFSAYSPGDTNLTGWTIGGSGVQHFSPSTGGFPSQVVQLTGDYIAGGSVSQTIATTIGASYTIILDAGTRNEPASGTVDFGGTVFAFNTSSINSLTPFLYTAVATATSTVVTISGDPLATGQDILVVDNVSVFQGIVGPVDPATSTVTAAPGTVPADGGNESTITVTLTDSNSLPVLGKTVTLASTSGPGTPVITTVSGVTDAGGEAVFTVTSTTVGTNVFTATDVTDGNLIIAQTASVVFEEISPSYVINGDFEDPVVATWAAYNPGDLTLTGWTIGGSGVQHFNGPWSGWPSQVVQLTDDYSAGGSVSQTIATMPGGTYVISVGVGTRSQPASGTVVFGETTNAFNATSVNSLTPLSWTSVATSVSTLLTISSDPLSTGQEILVIDNVGVAGPPPASLEIIAASYNAGAAQFTFSWNSQPAKQYDLLSATTVDTPLLWPAYNDGVTTTTNLPADPSFTNTLVVTAPVDAALFFAVLEKDIPPPLPLEDFEGGALPAAWSVIDNAGTGNTLWEVGEPSGAGTGPTTGAGGSTNCAGTNITGDYAADADVSLITPAIAIPAGGATLSFEQWIDTDLGNDIGTINVLNGGGGFLGQLATGIAGADAAWDTPPPSYSLAAYAGQTIKLEFLFTSDASSNWAGWYLDDVTVTAD